MSNKYSLYIHEIERVAKEFVETKPSYSLEIINLNEGKLKQIKIKKGRDIGVLNCFISGGQVSYNIQGKQVLNKICEECWEAILKETIIPCPNKKTFTIKDVKESDLESFIALISENSDVELLAKTSKNNSDAVRCQYILKGKFDARVSITYYNNGTLFLQGAVTSFYIELITEVMEVLSSVPSEIVKEFVSIKSSVGYEIEEDLNKHFGKMQYIEGSILEDFVKTSIVLANSGIVVEDYGCYTFGLMKAIDGLMTKILSEDAPDFENYGVYFEKKGNGIHRFRDNVITYDDRPLLKQSLEKAYDFYKKNRHTTFHIDRFNIETSRTLSYDEAINIIKEGLVIMNDLCTNS